MSKDLTKHIARWNAEKDELLRRVSFTDHVKVEQEFGKIQAVRDFVEVLEEAQVQSHEDDQNKVLEDRRDSHVSNSDESIFAKAYKAMWDDLSTFLDELRGEFGAHGQYEGLAQFCVEHDIDLRGLDDNIVDIHCGDKKITVEYGHSSPIRAHRRFDVLAEIISDAQGTFNAGEVGDIKAFAEWCDDMATVSVDVAEAWQEERKRNPDALSPLTRCANQWLYDHAQHADFVKLFGDLYSPLLDVLNNV